MRTDVCILGGGIMGLAAAYSIRRTSNLGVLVVDRYGVGNEYCSSNDVNRVFRYSYGNDRLYTGMAAESLKLWRQLEAESHQDLLITTGLLLLQGDDEQSNGFNVASYRTLSEMKLGAERLDSAELKRRFPQFRSNEAVFDPHGGVLLASKALTTLRALCEAKGVKFQQDQARKIATGDSLRATTASGEKIETGKLIMTIGPWSNSLLRDELVQVMPTRQQLVYFRPQGDLGRFRSASCPVFFTDKHYGLPAAGIDGVKMSPKELPERVDPETAKRSVDEDQIAECREAGRRFVPDIADAKVIRAKVCLYDMTENSDFVLDVDPDFPSRVYGYGFSGHGFKFAPLIGELLAQLALERRPSFDLERFSVIPSRRRAPALGAHLGQGK